MKRVRGHSFHWLSLIAAMLTLGFAACKSGGGSVSVQPTPGPTSPTNPKQPDPGYGAWYDVYGNYCQNSQPLPGCNFYSNGNKIQDYQDPYYTSKYLQYSDQWTYTDSYGYRQAYSGYAWLSTDGILYDEYGRALNEVTQDDSRDLLGQAADLEQQAVEFTGKALAEKYALSEEKGIEIAQTLNDWAVLGRERERTAADAESFMQKLYGVSMTDAQNALAEASTGKLDSLKELNQQIAQNWGTTPETSQAILTSWYGSQVVVK